jgi:hypothetical protein
MSCCFQTQLRSSDLLIALLDLQMEVTGTATSPPPQQRQPASFVLSPGELRAAQKAACGPVACSLPDLVALVGSKVCCTKGRNASKRFKPDDAVRRMDAALFKHGLVPAGRREKEPRESVLTFINRPHADFMVGFIDPVTLNDDNTLQTVRLL